MAKTYAQLKQEIDLLSNKAEAVRQREKAGVAARIRDAIDIYGFTFEELGFATGKSAAAKGPAAKGAKAKGPKARGAAKKSGSKPTAPKSAGQSRSTAKYSDGAGKEWSGRGPKPGWVKDGLAAGRTLESFAMNGGASTAGAPSDSSSAAAPAPRAGKKASKKYKSAVKYRGSEPGQQWSGRGPKPGWVADALANGKTMQDLAV